MRYLKPYKLFENRVYVDIVNDILLELSDLGFYTYSMGEKTSEIKLKRSDGLLSDKTSGFVIHKKPYFIFDEIKDIIYRIKDVVGISNISGLNFHEENSREYDICDIKDLENETLHLKLSEIKILSLIMSFKFPIES
jgi:hypothetical protein